MVVIFSLVIPGFLRIPVQLVHERRSVSSVLCASFYGYLSTEIPVYERYTVYRENFAWPEGEFKTGVIE